MNQFTHREFCSKTQKVLNLAKHQNRHSITLKHLWCQPSYAKRYNFPILAKSLQLHNLPVNCARGLFKPLKDLDSSLAQSTGELLELQSGMKLVLNV